MTEALGPAQPSQQVCPSSWSAVGMESVSHHQSSPLFPDPCPSPRLLLLHQTRSAAPPARPISPGQVMCVPYKPAQSPDYKPHYCPYPLVWDMAETPISTSCTPREPSSRAEAGLAQGWTSPQPHTLLRRVCEDQAGVFYPALRAARQEAPCSRIKGGHCGPAEPHSLQR